MMRGIFLTGRGAVNSAKGKRGRGSAGLSSEGKVVL
jgi:hypothetical protein